MYIQQGTAIVSSTLEAKSKALFHLEEVFYCHLASIHELRCLIEGEKDYYSF